MIELLLLGTAILAGFIGALLGLGGGVILIPALTLGFGIHIRYAIAASLLSIIVTSAVASRRFLAEGLASIRVAVFLETATVAGALCGFLVTSFLDAAKLYLLFGVFMFFSAALVARRREEQEVVVSHAWASKLGLSEPYGIAGLPLGWVILFFAGALSALLGIGSGIFKVLAMDSVMKLPLKASTATSNLMMGVTAAASAGAFLARGDVLAQIAGPVALGVLIGAALGAKAMVRMPANRIRRVFVLVLVVASAQMVWRGLQG
jgi:uncharacterized protein